MKIFTPKNFRPVAAFTMIEIAICLAIIGIALVGIIGILPYGMNTQRANREETVIGQDASVLLELIRNGSRGADDLTNYVFAVVVTNSAGRGYGLTSSIAGYMNFSTSWFPTVTTWFPITRGSNIIGALSTPQYTYNDGTPVFNTFSSGYNTNYVHAYIRAFSGIAADEPPQANSVMVGDSFAYRVLCVNAPLAMDTNLLVNSSFDRQLVGSQHDLRLTFAWPFLPSGNVGAGRQTFRVSVAGQLVNANGLYFYQSQSFTNNVN